MTGSGSEGEANWGPFAMVIVSFTGACLVCKIEKIASAGGRGWAVNERQAEALLRAREALDRAAQSMIDGLPVDFWTIDVKDALLALGEVTGTNASEDVLDRVFSTFCIGK